MASTTQRIFVVPVAPAQRPIPNADFYGEYFLAAATVQALNLRLAKRPCLRLELFGQKPDPIVFKANGLCSQGPAHVPLIVKLSASASGALNPSSLPSQCQLKSHLLSETLVTPNGILEIPTVEYPGCGEDSYVTSKKSHEQKFTLAIRHWVQRSSGKFGWHLIHEKLHLLTERRSRNRRLSKLGGRCKVVLPLRHFRRKATLFHFLHPAAAKKVFHRSSIVLFGELSPNFEIVTAAPNCIPSG